MTRYVVDASVAVEYLLRTQLGLVVADTVEASRLVAPELIDVEVVSVLRRAVLTECLDEDRALSALDDLTQRWPIERIPSRMLARMVWRYHHNVSAYDAFYVAAASAFEIPLLTTDGRLARAPGLGIAVQHIRLA